MSNRVDLRLLVKYLGCERGFPEKPEQLEKLQAIKDLSSYIKRQQRKDGESDSIYESCEDIRRMVQDLVADTQSFESMVYILSEALCELAQAVADADYERLELCKAAYKKFTKALGDNHD
jgi:hypothetical protein